ncbi:MAG: carboxypeptidase regulatory-like domain-containing protein [Coriobacteriia bacterium]|nr:carboxypeptidase regulatory-like domain-containing protein [Coriobacteriia bacterium]
MGVARADIGDGCAKKAARRFSLVVLSVVLVMLALLAPLAASAAGAASISGRVTASDGVTPLPNITVRLSKNTSGSWSDYGTKTTGTDGTYTFTGLINTTYAVEFRDTPGVYIPEYYNGKPTLAGADTITLGATENRTGIDASLDVASGIEGRVRDSAGQPVGGVVVNAYANRGGASYDTTLTAKATTAADGTYRLGGLAAGEYGLQFFSGAYASHYRGPDANSGVTAISRATPVAVLAGQSISGIDETMLRWGAIAGTVSGSSGALASVAVESYREEAGVWARQTAALTQSLAGGAFEATPLYPGRYRVMFTAPTGYPPQYHRSALSADLAAEVIVVESVTTQLDTRLVAADSAPPTSLVSGVPVGWSNAITASVTSTDGPSGSGVAVIHYWFGSDPASVYDGPFAVTEQGARVLSYRAVDGFGNREDTQTVAVMLDTTAPIASSNGTTAPYADSATIDLSATDDLSGVAQIIYKVGLSGEETSGSVVTLPVGSYSLYYGARDEAGNWSGFTGPLAITVVTLPEAPSDLVAVPTSPGAAIRLTWVDNSSSEAGFVVERARDTLISSAFSHVATIGADAASYTDADGLDWTSTWYYRVRAFNVAGQSSDAESLGLKLPAAHAITASAGAYGSISPSGVTTVTSGGSLTFTITPVVGYQVAYVLVDGSSVGAVSSYTFADVTANHTISAVFAQTPPPSNGTPTRPSTPPLVRHARNFSTFGYIVRHPSGSSPVTLYFYRYQSRRWVLKKSITARVSNWLSFSRYSKTTSVPTSGRWRVRARHKVGSKYRYSPYAYFTAN